MLLWSEGDGLNAADTGGFAAGVMAIISGVVLLLLLPKPLLEPTAKAPQARQRAYSEPLAAMLRWAPEVAPALPRSLLHDVVLRGARGALRPERLALTRHGTLALTRIAPHARLLPRRLGAAGATMDALIVVPQHRTTSAPAPDRVLRLARAVAALRVSGAGTNAAPPAPHLSDAAALPLNLEQRLAHLAVVLAAPLLGMVEELSPRVPLGAPAARRWLSAEADARRTPHPPPSPQLLPQPQRQPPPQQLPLPPPPRTYPLRRAFSAVPTGVGASDASAISR